MKTLFIPFRENVINHNLIQPNDTIIIGFSGGKDSVTLFFLLKELQKEIDFIIIVAYFNHRLRTDAQFEEEWVINFCENQNVQLITGTKNVIRFKNQNKLNLEHAASLSRYSFFKEISSHFPKSKIATAHTRSDLTETFFIKLFRGSGLQGLSTIYSKKENMIIRPLLIFDEEDIYAFLERNCITFYTDYTNKTDEFLRNRIRHHLIPQIHRIEPHIHDHIFKTVSIIQDEYDYFSRTATQILEQNLILGKILPPAILENYHPAIQRHIIREYIRKLKGNLLNIDFEHIEKIRTDYNCTQGVSIPQLQLSFHKGYIFPHPTTIPNYSYTITTQSKQLPIQEITRTLVIEKSTHFNKPSNNNEIYIPITKLIFPLTLRSPKQSDKYIKINTTINQKVIEMIRAAGIPSEIRGLNPVLVNGDGEIIWVLGAPISQKFKVDIPENSEFLKFFYI